MTGKPDQFHVRAWSTVIRLPTDRGAYFFKATWPPQRFEAGLTAALAEWAPEDVGIPLAIDARRGWLLLEDGGQRLREIITKDRDIRHCIACCRVTRSCRSHWSRTRGRS